MAFCLNTAEAGEMFAPEYVSIDCPQGDISLILKTDNSFKLEIKYWSQTENRHTHAERINGTWSSKGETLTLSGNVELTYIKDKTDLTVGSRSASIPSLKFLKGSLSTFANGFELVERTKVDKLFLEATKEQKKHNKAN
ncbi:MAG: copper resistance protein NlpE N-terminal domain-containing protein [Nitrospirota bacterium]